ncbi:MAG: hypothetical protein R2815_06995 [Flavobacteriales bacterium]|nr:hypothetical protein [Flavobacteriales bacterium]
MRAFLRSILVLLLITAIPAANHAQDGISRKKQEKLLEKKAKEEKKADKKRDKEGRKRHLDIQSKDTRKRIKRNTKRAERKGSGRHTDGFFSRLFSRKR